MDTLHKGDNIIIIIIIFIPKVLSLQVLFFYIISKLSKFPCV